MHVASSVLGITVLETLVVAKRAYGSGRVNGQWQDS